MNIIVANANGADDTWLGMTGITDGQLPSVWPFDKTPVDYIHWDKERLLNNEFLAYFVMKIAKVVITEP